MKWRFLIGHRVEALIDRPLGSRHPRHGFLYPVNYGFVPGLLSGDGDWLDAYVLGVREPLRSFIGECAGVIVRKDEDDPKLVLLPPGLAISDEAIRRETLFQERHFRSSILRS